MTGDPAGPGEDAAAAAHVDRAVIDVSRAEITQAPVPPWVLRSLALIFLFSIVVGLANLLWTNSQVHGLQATNAQVQKNTAQLAQQQQVLRKQILADCGFYRDLAGLPLMVPPGGHPPELAVKIISDSRAAWHGHDCPGQLPLPDPAYVAGAKLYHLPVN